MEKHNSCVNSLAIIQYIEEKAPDKLDYLLTDLGPEMEGIQDPKAFLSDPNNWISSSLMIELFRRAKIILGDDQAPMHIGFNSVLKRRLGYLQSVILFAFSSPHKAIKVLHKVNDRLNKTKRVEISRSTKTSATLKLHWTSGIPLSKDFCLMNRGVYQAIPVVWGLPPARLKEPKCFFKGDEYCEYHVSWKKKRVMAEIFKRIFRPWQVINESIKELEKDKLLLQKKYHEVYVLNQKLEKKIQQILTLKDSSVAILSTLELQELLDRILNKLLLVANLDRAGIFMADSSYSKLVLIHAVGINKDVLEEMKGYQVPIEKENNIIARTARAGKPIIVRDVKEMDLNPENVLLKKLRPKAFILVPLSVRDKVIGILVGDNHTDNTFVENIDSEFLTSFANHIAMALENARLYRELQESEKKYRGIVENANEGIWILNSGGIIEFANKRLCSMLGLDNLEGVSVYDLIPKEYKKKLLDMLLLNMEGRVSKEEMVLCGKNGHTVTVLLSSVPIKNNGVFEGCLTMITDLTEKKQMEIQLLQAQKLESIGTMAGGVAHDFNNLLTGILGYTSLLKQKTLDMPDLYNYVTVIEKSGMRAADLVKKLLAFSRQSQPDTLGISNLNDIIHDTIELLNRTLPKNITVDLNLASEDAEIKCDETQIQQVILNLCLNARDAMEEEGGRLTISTWLTSYDEIVQKQPGTDLIPGEYVALSVQDTGTGIDNETLNRIFDPFFTTKEIGKGSGLGLAMVYGIMKNLAGTILVESELGAGTTFTLYFPRAFKEVEDVASRSVVSSRTGNETILVVDDEEIVRDLAQELLESHGYKVLTAKNGQEAVHTYSAMGNEIDLVVLDIVMPRMGGMETYEKIINMNKEAKIIFCSGHDSGQTSIERIKEMKIPFIAKPFHTGDFLEKIRHVLDFSRPQLQDTKSLHN